MRACVDMLVGRWLGMLIILLEVLFLSFLIKNQHKVHNGVMLLFSFLTQLLILVAYSVELRIIWGRTVYWSDAEYYWQATIEMLKGLKPEVHNFGYVFYSWLIQKTSPFVTPLWNNISNVLLIDLSFFIGIQSILGENKMVRPRVPRFAYLVTISNPLVIYSLLRNLKDVLFLFMVTLSIYIGSKIGKKTCSDNPTKHKLSVVILSLFLVLYIALFSVSLTSVRPWGWAIPITNIFFILFLILLRNNGSQKYKSSLIAILVIIVGILYLSFSSLYKQVGVWLENRDVLLQEGRQYNKVTSLLIGPFVMLFGPGPVRSLFGDMYFQYYTLVGNISAFIGSTIWYFFLPLFFLLVVKNFQHVFKSYSGGMLICILLELLLIYSYFYGGSTELRFRGVVYLLAGLTYVATTFHGIRTKNQSLFFLSPSYYVFWGLNIIAIIFSLK
jgi:hypothetical protein